MTIIFIQWVISFITFGTSFIRIVNRNSMKNVFEPFESFANEVDLNLQASNGYRRCQKLYLGLRTT